MMKKLTIGVLVASFFYFVLSTAQAFAVSVADFPACSNPQWSMTVSYDSGIHGIVGDSATHTGSDKVYQSSDGNKNVQCFCPLDGTSGIQTNWVKLNTLSQEEIAVLEHDGWLYIPSGASWGLSDDPYLAKNIAVSCNAGGSSDSTSSSSNGSSNSGSGASSGVVEAVGAVLGLANTGNTMTLLAVAISSLVAFLLSFLLRKSH